MSRSVKLVVVGDGTVGKSSLIARFVSDGFRPMYAQTVGIDFFEKLVTVRGADIDLQLWDIGGQSLNSNMLDKYVGNADAVLVVYDLTSQASLLDVDDWLDRVRAVTRRQTHFFVVGNKADLLRQRQVSDAEHTDFWTSRRLAGGFLASAASGENVCRIVYQVAAVALGMSLSEHELNFHDRVLSARLGNIPADDAHGRTPDADRIEAEDRLAELAKRRREARRACCCIA